MLPWEDGTSGGVDDIQWNSTPGYHDRNWIDWGGGLRSITNKKFRYEQSVGEWVCKNGVTTGYDCGTIQQTDFDGANVRVDIPVEVGESTTPLLLLILIVILVAGTACGSTLPTGSTDATPWPVATELLEAFGPTELILIDGCLGLKSGRGGKAAVLAWPPWFTVNRDGDTVTVVNERDNTSQVLHIGDLVSGGGGTVEEREHLGEPVREGMPAHCPPPYYLITEIRPAE